MYEIPISSKVHYFVCSKELDEREAQKRGYLHEYFFLIVYADSYTFTEPKGDIKEIFDDFPSIISIWEREAHKETEKKRRVRII